MTDLEERAEKLKASVVERALAAKLALGTPLTYRVLVNSCIFQEPVPRTTRLGSVAKGTVARGYPGSVAWVCLDPASHDGTEGWVPVREMTDDRRLVLHAAWCELKLEKSFVDALEVSWLGIEEPPPPFKVTYSVEWRPRPPKPAKEDAARGRQDAANTPAAGHTLSSEASATVRSLPPGSMLQLRVGVRVAPAAGAAAPSGSGNGNLDVRLSGPWQDFATDHAMKADYLDGSSLSSLMSLRASGALPKRFLRAVRGGMWGLEYRINEMGDDGVFTPEEVTAGTPIEVCPLLEVDTDCRRRSPVLQRLTLPLPGRKDAYAVVLGFAQLYSRSKEPNLRWGYLGPDEVLVWAVEDIPARSELFVDFATPPEPVEEAAQRRPSILRQPPQKPRNAPEKFSGAGFVVHGDSGLHGRGVFATRTTEPGQLIESCPVVQMDEAGGEALISYRWGAKTRGAGPFYIPMGHGCLYNHSERQNAHAQLDLGRHVLELVALEPLHVGQEILVNYGSDYFSDDYDGHRKGELLHVKDVNSEDLEIRMYAELLQALMRTFRDEGFQREFSAFQQPLSPEATKSQQAMVKDIGRRSALARAAIIKAELPILERFGFSKDLEGSVEMTSFLHKMFFDPRTSNDLKDLSQEVVQLTRVSPPGTS
uniref:SET domain-containing protein n=1 Tax=Alexandrium monilatum TaxID=311494 RepID=A0A7S4S7P5_9DINO|mmetsp:Transcript_50381/g.150632  ORF Transcript_50381/g.150632 Transcript_50381/m.150632 type:complete len:650 (-) Transcript_50381:39-1988(-)